MRRIRIFLFFKNLIKSNLNGKTVLSAHTSMALNFGATKLNNKIKGVPTPQKLRTLEDDFFIDIPVNNATIAPKGKGKQGVLPRALKINTRPEDFTSGGGLYWGLSVSSELWH
mgnify:CR=1 FL=1